ncbi:MAG: flavocytochrome c [Desulfobacterales bacterium]|nr:flavocytochrome c [Desulfobacterales bacterium]
MPAWDETTDIIIIGSGAAGLSAAIEAGRAGASVLVLEQMKVTGGNTRISDGGLAAPGNPLQKQQGIKDSAELLYQDMLAAGMGLNNPHLARIVAEKAGEAVNWTINDLGVRYQDRLDRFGGHSVARCLTTRSHSGADIIRAQRARLDALGVDIRTRCRLVRLITDKGGAVSGVRIRSGGRFGAKDSGIVKHIRARRAVILATGGFGNDVSFRTRQNPALDESIGTTNHRGATAEGLIAALKINAAAVHLSWIQLGPWGCADETGYGRGASFASYSVYPAGILIDPATGGRIVNEWADRRRRCDAMFKAGHVCVGIVDASGAARASDSLARALKRGVVKGFENMLDLASAYQMPVRQLKATMERYNRMVAEGKQDEFGKPLGQGAQLIVTPPFYAIRLWPKVHYTPGGLQINSNAQVLDLDGRPIAGLFAAGEVCGGIHGASRLGSCALPECIVFGRIAGRQAAAASRR